MSSVRKESAPRGAKVREALDAPSDTEARALFDAVAKQTSEDRGLEAFLRSRSTAVRVATGLGLSALIATGFATFVGFGTLARYPAWRNALDLGVIGLLAALGVVLGLRPLTVAPLPRSVVRTLDGVSLAAVLMVALLPAEAAPDASAHPLLGVVVCFTIGAALGGAALLVLRLLDRGHQNGAFARVAAAGLVGNLALRLHCPNVMPAHLLFGHAGVPIALIGGYLAWRALRRSGATATR